MTTTDTHATFIAAERAYIRSEVDRYFTTFSAVAEGLMLRTWKPDPAPASRSWDLPRLFFTATGLAALRTMMSDRRLADPEKFAHIRVEFGIDPPTEAKAAK